MELNEENKCKFGFGFVQQSLDWKVGQGQQTKSANNFGTAI